MHIDEIMGKLRAQPFRPFVLHLASGRNILVQHPDFFARSPGGTSITVYSPEGDQEPIDTRLIASLLTDTDESTGRSGQ